MENESIFVMKMTLPIKSVDFSGHAKWEFHGIEKIIKAAIVKTPYVTLRKLINGCVIM